MIKFLTMKKIFVFIAALASLAGCSKEDRTEGGNENGRMAIAPNAGVENNLIGSAADGTESFKDGKDVFRLSAFLSDDSAPDDWTVDADTEAFENIQVNMATTLSLETPKYYPPSGAGKLWFYAYAPSQGGTYTPGSMNNKPSVSYTITGQEDIMVGHVTNGNGIGGATSGTIQKQPELLFEHMLKRVEFIVKAGSTFDESDNVRVDKIVVKNVKTAATLNFVDETLTFSGDADQTLTLSGGNTEITAAGNPVPGYLMFEPGTTFTISVTAGGVTYADATVTLTGGNVGEAGVSHAVTLTFNRSGIVPTASIKPWTEGADTDVDIQ